ncbi:DUF4179 domain-containing protein [Neobacillus vireti]|uniref:DUF4179 domain-containing protein n=1 Tax=Neobacillus vireti LMG 21834 TaxID=1131730 RepID=A0AB94IUV7_9BACI|nr:DUF4179 domain-containing protein [Neobacillus vireti]ETI70812.1 hypothetical protein BAVI_00395 [Neobacillus vireti LMG 21834]KLT17649.1 hypothetical protein AA980_11045 [Neobacillus vireti]
MYEKEEEQLKNLYDNVQVPLDSLDEAIFAGFQKATSEKKRHSIRKKWLFTLAAAAVIFVSFLTSIRLSPAFANYISVIPGMEKLVDLIRDDKGKMLAVENDYYEKIGVSQEKNGIKFTIDGVIADENGLILFYTINTKEKEKELNTGEVELKSLDEKSLEKGSSMLGRAFYSEKGETSHSDKFEFYFQSPLEVKKFEVKVDVKVKKQKENFTLQFELKKEIQQKKTYVLNKDVEIKRQKFTVINVDVYPLRVAVHVKMDPQNTKKLLNFDDIRLIDEHGETWYKIANGFTGSKISDDEAIIYLQSNYFQEPKELYLVINKIQAIDKEDAYVMIDIEKEQILKQPKGNKFTALKVEGDQIILSMRPKKEFSFDLFNLVRDRDGNEIDKAGGFLSHNFEDEKVTEYGVSIPGLKDKLSPISLEIFFFPSWIEGSEKIKIK